VADVVDLEAWRQYQQRRALVAYVEPSSPVSPVCGGCGGIWFLLRAVRPETDPGVVMLGVDEDGDLRVVGFVGRLTCMDCGLRHPGRA